MTTGKSIALTRWTFVGKVMSLLFNMLSRLVITFLGRSKRLFISWLQSPSAVILENPASKKKTKNKKQKTKNTQFDHSLAGRKKGPGKMFKGDRKDEAVLDNSVVCHGLLRIRKAGCT